MSRNTVARIDTRALRHNHGVVRRLAGDSRVVSVVKADAYGHGTRRVARALADTDLLAVATLGEAFVVRDSGWLGGLLLLEGCAGAEEFDQARMLGAELVVHSLEQLELLEARGLDAEQRAWLKLDTGMHRLGFPAADVAGLFDRLRAVAGPRPPVLMTHFACADDADNPMTAAQIGRFDAATEGLSGPRSLANSAAVINFRHSCRDFIRPGIMLYGVSPVPGSRGEDHGLRPAMTLSCPLLAINRCARGDTVGYGARYRCPEDMRVGVAGIGYGDGYPRSLRDGAPVLVNGRRAALAGAVSMDLITIDLRGHDDARVGDTVVLWGKGLPLEEVAAWADTIPYTLICGVTRRVRREVV